MSLRLMIYGPESCGKSTVAGQLALLLQKVAKRTAKPLAVVTVPSRVYRRMPVKVVAARSGREFLAALQSAPSGATVIADELSDVYSGMLTGSYVEAARLARAEAGLPEHWGVLGPNDFRVIRNRYDSLWRSARSLNLDLVELYRLGSGEGGDLRLRGASGALRGADLIVFLEGGLESRIRRIRVLADASFEASQEPRELPRIGSPRDLRTLLALLSDMLVPSLSALLEMDAEDNGLWAEMQEPAPDQWPEVSALAHRAEAEQITSQIRAVCDINGLYGQEKTRLLYEHFKVGDSESLLSVDPLTLRLNLDRFVAAAAQAQKAREEGERLRRRVRQLLDVHGLGGTSGEARAGRARRLLEAFGTDLDGLETLPLSALKEGLVLFMAGFPSAGEQVA